MKRGVPDVMEGKVKPKPLERIEGKLPSEIAEKSAIYLTKSGTAPVPPQEISLHRMEKGAVEAQRAKIARLHEVR